MQKVKHGKIIEVFLAFLSLEFIDIVVTYQHLGSTTETGQARL